MQTMEQNSQEWSGRQVCRLPMERIMLRRDGRHGYEDSDALNALAASISRDGLVQAITVRPVSGGRYVIESGNRRFRACRMAGMKYIEAVVLPARTEAGEERALLEQLAKADGHYLDQAELMRTLHDAYDVPVCLMAQKLGESEQTVESRMRLSALDAQTCAVIREAGLPERTAQALLRVPEPQVREELARRTQRDRLTPGEVEMLATSARTRLPAVPDLHGQTIGAVRDGRLYLNALRTIAAQMQEAGLAAEITESTEGRTHTVSVSVSTRRRRSQRRQSQYSQAVQ